MTPFTEFIKLMTIHEPTTQNSRPESLILSAISLPHVSHDPTGSRVDGSTRPAQRGGRIDHTPFTPTGGFLDSRGTTPPQSRRGSGPVDEELQKIKRYEDFSTIDWVQDAIHERYRITALQEQSDDSWRSWVRLSYEAAQAWIVVLLVGVGIGLNAALIAIVTEWLSDIKMGYCSTGWWLNQKFCCWAIEEQGICIGGPSCQERDVRGGVRAMWIFPSVWLSCDRVTQRHGLNQLNEWRAARLRVTRRHLNRSLVAHPPDLSFCRWLVPPMDDVERGTISGTGILHSELAHFPFLFAQPRFSLDMRSGSAYIRRNDVIRTCQTTFATVCAFLVKEFAPYAAGSGISEIKCILAGFVMKGFLGGWTLLIKSIGLALAVASNLSIGKEGPSVHMGCCVGNVVSRYFPKYQRNKAKMREILSASSAAGVAVAFGSPIGGVLFSLEEMSSNFPMKTMWRSFFCALIATMVLQVSTLLPLSMFVIRDHNDIINLTAMNPFRTGKLVMFQVTYDRDWHMFEVIFFSIIGLFGGLYGAFVIKWNLFWVSLRKKHLKDYPIPEAATLAFITAVIAYPNVFMRIDMTEIMGILFQECEAGTNDYFGLCQLDQVWSIITLLFISTLVRTTGVIVSYGARVPCGIFVPSMAIGATFGRALGLVVKVWQHYNPGFFLFASCKPDVPCMTPGMYAFLGAAAALWYVVIANVSLLSYSCMAFNSTESCPTDLILLYPQTFDFLLPFSVVVIMFELTGQITYILPTMITLLVTKAVGDWFGRGGIADRYIQLNGYPFLDKEEHTFGVPGTSVCESWQRKVMSTRCIQSTLFGYLVIPNMLNLSSPLSHVMQRDLIVMPLAGRKLDEIEMILHDTQYQGFPIVQDKQNMTLLGYIGRSELRYAIDKSKRIHGATSTAHCFFNVDGRSSPSLTSVSDQGFEDNGANARSVDFGPYIDHVRFLLYTVLGKTPITVHPRLPLETVMDLFKKMGPTKVSGSPYRSASFMTCSCSTTSFVSDKRRPRVILIEFAGRLVGLVTVKDVLKYIARTEARGRSQPGDPDYEYGASGADAWWEERYWGIGGRYSRVRRSANGSYIGVGGGSNGPASVSPSAAGIDRSSLESEDVEMERWRV
ncbi:chloride channel [Jimgerdemannia flammicorona]|uniref:Chloride channel protein n=1 Tax=Jimgerdemannia flammicorona TaxID=994334 RepID=A0A433DKV7_9FUNG|nr:chloride channel [Jimgerdemannia flammicorona]